MLNINSIILHSENPERLFEFYEKVFQSAPELADGHWKGWQVGSCFLTIGGHSEVKGKSATPARIMFNIETEAVKETFDLVVSAGAEVISKPYEMSDNRGWMATVADPDGNYFQLMTPWNKN